MIEAHEKIRQLLDLIENGGITNLDKLQTYNIIVNQCRGMRTEIIGKYCTYRN